MLAEKGAKGGANGTTLAASKDLNICRVSDAGTTDDASDDTWRYYGNISVWQEGAQDTQGLAITDWIQFKAFDASGQFVDTYLATCQGCLHSSLVYTQENAVLFSYTFEGLALNGYMKNSAIARSRAHSGHLGTPWGPIPTAYLRWTPRPRLAALRR